MKDTWTVRDLMQVLINYPQDTEVYMWDQRGEDYFDIRAVYDSSDKIDRPNRDDAVFLTFNLKED